MLWRHYEKRKDFLHWKDIEIGGVKRYGIDALGAMAQDCSVPFDRNHYHTGKSQLHIPVSDYDSNSQ